VTKEVSLQLNARAS